MIHTFTYFPGQIATIFVETLDGYGQRSDLDGYGYPTDGYGVAPQIDRIIYPDLSVADGFPQSIIKLDVGLYYYQIALPSGVISLGTYLVDASYVFEEHTLIQSFQILINAPYGNFSVTTSL